MSKTITRKEMRWRIEQVLGIAPNLEPSEVFYALLCKYPFKVIEEIMHEMKEEKLEQLREMSPRIIVVDTPLEEVIENAEKKKKEKIKEQDRE